ncbi:hypothetical protein HID58_075759 [Brassica napus]|uniref:HMG box domain-containing protein n=2 Tax=Brassica napus TaxID=3708 RepID=A0ABQ7YM87_BRANA|nr:hypothetical protein HID58_075759 [Brassica napus]
MADDFSPAESAMKGGNSKSDSRNSKLSVNKKPTKASKAAAKDPNKPKRPASAFFVFMEDFRQTYKKEHPSNKSVAAVGKAGGEKWKSLSDSEKAPYVAKADKRKVEYEKTMKAYNKKLEEGPKGDEESDDKSVSEVSEEEDADDRSDEVRSLILLTCLYMTLARCLFSLSVSLS